MYTRGNSFKRFAKLALKIVALVGVYVFFYLYTIPAFNTAKTFVAERLAVDSKVILIGESAVTIEVADSDSERMQGLSGRESLEPGHGMFFIFDQPGLHGIWMKDMNFPIDIIWFDQYGELVYFEEHVTPESYPDTFFPKSPSLYVLEVPAGFVKDKNIKLGDKIDFY
jgi:uncharacterized membrane protein (UPF0127 family)